MRQYTYPAVFYYDEEYEDYAVEFSDICIYAEGDTMEDAYQNAQKYLLAYLETCEELNIAPNKPNTYTDILKSHANGQVMLVTVEYESKNKKQENKVEEKQFASLADDIVEDIEAGLNEGENPTLTRYLKQEVQREQKERENPNDGDDDFGLPEIE